MQKTGILGGSFDPVHSGHIAMAAEVSERFSLSRLHFMPCGQHAFGKPLQASSSSRLAMLRLAVKGQQEWYIDERELQRDEVSYTVDSCREIREELGAGVAICFIAGSDVLGTLNRWHRWRELFDYVNVIVVHRSAETSPTSDTASKLFLEIQPAQEVNELLDRAVDVIDQPHGQLALTRLPPYPYSSTAIRQRLAKPELQQLIEKGDPVPQDLAEALNPLVLAYIVKNGLYVQGQQ